MNGPARINYDLFSGNFWKFHGKSKIFLKELIRFKSIRRYVIEDTFKWRFYRLFGCEHEFMKSSDYVFCIKCLKSKKKILRKKYEKGKMTEEEQTEYILGEV